MAHTQGRYQQDLGFPDGRVFTTPNDLAFVTTGGSLTLTRIAAGDWSLRAANSTTGQIGVNVAAVILRRLGFGEDLQEQFGGTGIPGSAQPQIYRPDVIPAMAALQQITPRTALKIKGFKLLSYDVIYTVSGADATTLTTRADSIQYKDNVAVPAPTVVLATGNNGLVKTQRANAYVTNVVIPAPVYSNLADSALWVEVGLVTPGGGTLDFRGFDWVVEFNFN